MESEQDDAKLRRAAEAAERIINSPGLPVREAKLVPFDNEVYLGLAIKWAERGVGFGEITISCKKETGEWHVDTEEMSPAFCGRIFMALDKEKT